jgi:catechol 2,3-dioxygenase-like lactoylglutathione lyase family enzyme
MFDHLQIKVTDLEECRAFYEAVLAALGYRIVFEVEGVVGIGTSTHDMFEIRQAGDDAPLSSAVHVAFTAPSRRAVDEFHRAALARGARDNGPPGLRPEYEPGYYAAFVIDPNGHNLEAVFMESPPAGAA